MQLPRVQPWQPPSCCPAAPRCHWGSTDLRDPLPTSGSGCPASPPCPVSPPLVPALCLRPELGRGPRSTPWPGWQQRRPRCGAPVPVMVGDIWHQFWQAETGSSAAVCRQLPPWPLAVGRVPAASTPGPCGLHPSSTVPSTLPPWPSIPVPSALHPHLRYPPSSASSVSVTVHLHPTHPWSLSPSPVPFALHPCPPATTRSHNDTGTGSHGRTDVCGLHPQEDALVPVL